MNSTMYCEILNKSEINKHDMLSRGMVLLHVNVRLHESRSHPFAGNNVITLHAVQSNPKYLF